MNIDTKSMNMEKYHNFHGVEVNLLNMKLKMNEHTFSLEVICVKGTLFFNKNGYVILKNSAKKVLNKENHYNKHP